MTARCYSTLTHVNSDGKVSMVDVSGKPSSVREARAKASVYLGPTVFKLVQDNQIKKGDVLSVAQVAGAMAAKKTGDLIPLCHNIPLTHVDVRLSLVPEQHLVVIESSAKCVGQTGAEMEALTSATVAALTVYDMCKAVSREIVITNIHLTAKSGGVRGDYVSSSSSSPTSNSS